MNTDLIEQYKKVHEKKANYGNNFGKGRYFDEMVNFLKQNECSSILDFGCGKGKLKTELTKVGFSCDGYDPAIEKFSTFPTKDYDAVVSTDVFEHLDENSITDEFSLIKSVNPSFLYFNVATGKAGEILPCGINAHTIIKNACWWKDTISKHFIDFEIVESSSQNSIGAASVIFALQKIK